MDNRCVACGEIIPEGRMVCKACEVMPCTKDCEKRTVTCKYDGTCDKYSTWKRGNDAKNKVLFDMACKRNAFKEVKDAAFAAQKREKRRGKKRNF